MIQNIFMPEAERRFSEQFFPKCEAVGLTLFSRVRCMFPFPLNYLYLFIHKMNSNQLI